MCKISRVAAKKLAALFIATTPAACQPQTSQHFVAPVEALAPVSVRILGDGTIMIKDAPVSRDELDAQLAKLAAMDPQPEVHVEPELGAPYGNIDHVMAALQRAGLKRMGVIGGT